MPKKLSLSTETLRVLADEELAAVKGARKTGRTQCKATKTRSARCR
jgi:hypothetical protein